MRLILRSFSRLVKQFIERWLLMAVALAAVVLFFSPIRNLFDNVLVEGVLSRLQSSLQVDIGMGLIGLIILLWCMYMLISGHFLSTLFCLVVLAFTGLFIWARLTSAYEFYGFRLLPFKYADLVLFFFAAVIVIKVKNWYDRYRKIPDEADPFLVDKPVENEDDDKFGRAPFAAAIARKIQSKTNSNASLAIGINGSWGSGKSSFLNLIQKEVKKRKQIIINFNPWTSASSVSIVPHFFESLAGHVAPYDSRLPRLIRRYATSVAEIAESAGWMTSLNNFLDVLPGENAAPDHKQISDAIRNINKRIIVFIDDLDRLDHHEIIEVLKLIRNTANFNHVVYVAAYDRAYVNEAIKQYNAYQFQQFVDKIFDVEFSLPVYEPSFISKYLLKILRAKLDAKFHPELQQIIERKEYSGSSLAQIMLTTSRDALRLCNALLFDIKPVVDEISVRDFYLMELLKTKFKIVFDALATGKHRFFIYTTDSVHGETLVFRGHGDLGKTAEAVTIEKIFDKDPKPKKGDKLEFDVFLSSLVGEKLLKGEDKEIIWIIMKMLVPDQEPSYRLLGNKQVDPKSYRYARNYHKYFSYQLFTGDISISEIEKFRRGLYPAFLEKVRQWVDEGKKERLLELLRPINQFDDQQEFENYARINFFLGRLESVGHSWINFEYNHLIAVLPYPLKQQPLYDSADSYRKFITGLFDEAEPPAFFGSALVSALITSHVDLGIPWQDLAAINRRFLREYGDNMQTFRPEIWNLFHQCIIVPEDANHDTFKDPEAKTYLLQRYKELTTAEELGFFIRQANPGSAYFHFEKDTCDFFAQSERDLLNWINSFPSVDKTCNAFKEFTEFFAQSEKVDFRPIEFSFQYLEPRMWK